MNATRPIQSVIFPVLNEAACIEASILAARNVLPEAELIVADGGSGDDTQAIARSLGTTVVHAGGRGAQCNAGAAVAAGELFVFLHGDTRLSPEADEALAEAAADPDFMCGTFRPVFDAPGTLLRVSEWMTKFDTVYTRFGDQGIVVRRGFFETIGGFPAWPLFDDVEFLRRARRRTPVRRLPAVATTSARRFRRHGVLRQQLRNGILLTRFLLGGDPHRMAEQYFRRRHARKGSDTRTTREIQTTTKKPEAA